MSKQGFRHFIAVDFSGAKSTSVQRKTIWLCRGAGLTWEGTDTFTVSELRCGMTRRELFEYVASLEAGKNSGVMVGFDFPFSFPAGFPEDVPGEWDGLAEALASTGAGEFIAKNAPPFYGNLGDARVSKKDRRFFAGARFEELRRTEELAPGAESTFKLAGPKQVGKGALRGIPHLFRLARKRPHTHAIWPFAGPVGREKVVLVEIFPRLFLGSVRKSVVQARLELINNLRADNVLIPGHVREAALAFPDALDSLMGAVGMWFEETHHDRLGRYAPEMYQDPVVLREGWIYGVDYPGS